LQKTQEQLRTRNDELVEIREKLEIRVRERTADLTRTNAELKRQINERKRLENELIDATEKERKRIGIDLHDDLGQHLNGIALMLKGLELKLQNRGLDEAAEAARIQSLVFKTINLAHNVAKGLASMDFQGDDDLSQALTALAAHVKSLFGIACTFNLSGETPPLPIPVVSQLYKIAQEAVTNAVKHGQAKQVEISLGNDDDKMVLVIKNDGLPFPEKDRASGRMGLHIMTHRASVIDASLTVKGLGRRGTIVTCVLPHKNTGNAEWPKNSPSAKVAAVSDALVQA
jgi:signal transduction histidine kinase